MHHQTKERILAAAADVFTEYGFAGASIRDIAKKAGINQSQIYHHIGNKEQLWAHVKDELTQNAAPSLAKETYESLTEFLIDITSRYVDMHDADPRIERILKWQGLESSPPTGAPEMNKISHQWIAAISTLQELNQITADYPPAQISTLIHSILSGITLYTSTHQDERQQYIIMAIECLYTALTPNENLITDL